MPDFQPDLLELELELVLDAAQRLAAGSADSDDEEWPEHVVLAFVTRVVWVSGRAEAGLPGRGGGAGQVRRPGEPGRGGGVVPPRGGGAPSRGGGRAVAGAARSRAGAAAVPAARGVGAAGAVAPSSRVLLRACASACGEAARARSTASARDALERDVVESCAVLVLLRRVHAVVEHGRAAHLVAALACGPARRCAPRSPRTRRAAAGGSSIDPSSRRAPAEAARALVRAPTIDVPGRGVMR